MANANGLQRATFNINKMAVDARSRQCKMDNTGSVTSLPRVVKIKMQLKSQI